MSTYFTMAAEITCRDRAAFDSVVKFLDDAGWLADHKWFQTEHGSGALCADDRREAGDLNPAELTITVPQAYYRNLARHADRLFAGGTGTLVWTSTDGMFSGGVVKDGVDTLQVADLEKWWKEMGDGEEAPSIDDAEKYCQWQTEVQEAFIEEHQP